MKRKHVFALVAIALLAALCFGGSGCNADQASKVQQGAQDIEYITGVAPAPATTQTSTQPSAIEIAHGAVTATKIIYPPSESVIYLVGLLAGAVSGLAGLFAGKKSAGQKVSQLAQQVGNAHSTIGELVDDVAAYKNPGEPWTATTAKVLTDLGHVDAAAVQA